MIRERQGQFCLRRISIDRGVTCVQLSTFITIDFESYCLCMTLVSFIHWPEPFVMNKSRITVNFYFAKLCLPFSIRSEGHCRECEVKDEEEVHTRACDPSQVWQCYDSVVAKFWSVLSKNQVVETPKHFQT